jgi:hypothetical protein
VVDVERGLGLAVLYEERHHVDVGLIAVGVLLERLVELLQGLGVAAEEVELPDSTVASADSVRLLRRRYSTISRSQPITALRQEAAALSCSPTAS